MSCFLLPYHDKHKLTDTTLHYVCRSTVERSTDAATMPCNITVQTSDEQGSSALLTEPFYGILCCSVYLFIHNFANKRILLYFKVIRTFQGHNIAIMLN